MAQREGTSDRMELAELLDEDAGGLADLLPLIGNQWKPTVERLREAAMCLRALDALPAATTPWTDEDMQAAQREIKQITADRDEYREALRVQLDKASKWKTVLPSEVVGGLDADGAEQLEADKARPDQFGESNDLNGLIQPVRSPEELAAQIIDAIPDALGMMPDPWADKPGTDGQPHKMVAELIRNYLKGN